MSSAQATPIGELSFTGSVTFTTNHEDFLPAAGPNGLFTVAAPTTLTPPVGTTGLILDMDRATSPVGSNVLIANSLTFAAVPTLAFDLTRLEPGIFGTSDLFIAPAPGQTATPAGTQYNFVNTSSTSSTLSFTVQGIMRDGTAPDTAYTGLFTAQFSNQPFQSVFATLNAGGSVTSAYSAHFTPTIPEPVGAALALAGMLTCTRLFARRRA